MFSTRALNQLCMFNDNNLKRLIPRFPNRIKLQHNTIELKFKTLSENGLILWSSLEQTSDTLIGDFLAVALSDGLVEFSFNLGKQNTRLKLKGSSKLNDNKYHHLLIIRYVKSDALNF